MMQVGETGGPVAGGGGDRKSKMKNETKRLVVTLEKPPIEVKVVLFSYCSWTS